VPALPDDPKARNEMEKETLGLFLSSHPLKEVRPALRARVDCSLAEIGDRKDGDWVTVGGMITECKRIRTKKGDMMMFAQLDDLEGSCEILVFSSAYQSNAEKIDVDRLVIVRGRVDHKDQNETKVVVQEVTPFEPTEAEVDKARIKMARLDAEAAIVQQVRVRLEGPVQAGVLDELKDLIVQHKGERELVLEVGDRTLVLGHDFRVNGSGQLLQELRDTIAGGGGQVSVGDSAPPVPQPVG
jgi:DNA polymerase-3 subunit alpha